MLPIKWKALNVARKPEAIKKNLFLHDVVSGLNHGAPVVHSDLAFLMTLAGVIDNDDGEQRAWIQIMKFKQEGKWLFVTQVTTDITFGGMVSLEEDRYILRSHPDLQSELFQFIFPTAPDKTTRFLECRLCRSDREELRLASSTFARMFGLNPPPPPPEQEQQSPKEPFEAFAAVTIGTCFGRKEMVVKLAHHVRLSS